MRKRRPVDTKHYAALNNTLKVYEKYPPKVAALLGGSIVTHTWDKLVDILKYRTMDQLSFSDYYQEDPEEM